MEKENKLHISFAELSLRGSKILSQQSAISYAQAIQQVERLKKTSKVSSFKKAQAEFLIQYCNNHNLFLDTLPLEEQFIAKGGEATVYLSLDRRNVIKLNDAGYYATWLEFFNSVLLHNIFFPYTSYQLLGISFVDNKLMAVVQQPYIISDSLVDLADIKEFLEFNGFKNTKRQDYKNDEMGLILEDMHDENVLRNTDTLFFIDSVFYTISH